MNNEEIHNANDFKLRELQGYIYRKLLQMFIIFICDSNDIRYNDYIYNKIISEIDNDILSYYIKVINNSIMSDEIPNLLYNILSNSDTFNNMASKIDTDDGNYFRLDTQSMLKAIANLSKFKD